MKLASYSDSDTQKVGRLCGEFLETYIQNHKTPVLVMLQGELGSGKTVLTKGILSAFGITPHGASPTFVIMKKYIPQHESPVSSLIHIDAYRLEKESNLEAIGFNDLTKENSIVIIEWPENITYSPNLPRISIVCSHGKEENVRYIEIKKPQ